MQSVPLFRIEDEFDTYIEAAHAAKSLDRALRFIIRAENVIRSFDDLPEDFKQYKYETVEDTRRIIREKFETPKKDE